jgi:hypothetical protein
MNTRLNFICILFVAAFALTLAGCGIYETKNTAATNESVAQLLQNPSAHISYAQVKQFVIAPSCMGCHSAARASGGISLETYALVAAQIQDMKADIDSGDMPLNGSLSSDQIKLFDKWFAEGYPETGAGGEVPMPTPPASASPSVSPPVATPTVNPSSPSATPPPQSLRISFADVNREVFQVSCLTCHSASAHRGGIILTTYPEVKALLADVKADILDGSMPINGMLTSDQKNLFNTWIAEGANEFSSPETPSTNPSPSSTPSSTPSTSPIATPSATPPLPSGPSETLVLATIRQNFEVTIRPLVMRACMDCHDSHAVPLGIGRLPIVRNVERRHIRQASAILDFSRTFPDWSTTNQNASSFLTQIRGAMSTRSMPPAYFRIAHTLDHKNLSPTENRTILDWVDQSLLLLQSASTSPPNAITYLQNNCVGCHNSTLRSGGLSFLNEQNQIEPPAGSTVNGTPYFVAFNPDGSAIYQSLFNDINIRHGLRQMPLGGQASEADQAIIRDWIMQSR